MYIAETDHLIIREIPNRATPKLGVAFFFPYMSPVPAEQSRVVKRYFDGDHLSVQPIGPSPAILHVDMLKKVTPLWYDLSVTLKADRDADRAFGWVLEMWGYSLAAARVGLKHYVWQQLQIEPSATWHQNVTSENPFIYHYTFGVEYTSDGCRSPARSASGASTSATTLGRTRRRRSNGCRVPRCAWVCGDVQ